MRYLVLPEGQVMVGWLVGFFFKGISTFDVI